MATEETSLGVGTPSRFSKKSSPPEAFTGLGGAQINFSANFILSLDERREGCRSHIAKLIRALSARAAPAAPVKVRVSPNAPSANADGIATARRLWREPGRHA